MKRQVSAKGGFTLVELLITMLLLGIVSASMLTLFVSLVRSAVIAKRQAVASTLATNQMEYLKSLPYDSLVIAGGSIYTTGTTLPATKTQKLNGETYTITTAINFIDDAYDGCGSYATQALKQQYCRNYPPPAGATTDSSPYDYKIIDVSVTDASHLHLADVDTEVAARVAESGTTKGALTVTVVDGVGNPVSGANVNIVDTSLTPALNLNGTTDQNGIFIFYDLPPDTTGNHYVVTASASGYSSLRTIGPSGSLQATYPSQNILSQSSSAVTMVVKPMTSASLAIEAVNTSGSPLANAKIYVKGGYKKYTSTSDTSYCYDDLTNGNLTDCSTQSATDTRPVTDAGGLAALSNLVPGNYIFCGDAGATSCSVGGTTYYLAAAVPYSGNNAFNPITVPTYDATNPPATTYAYNGNNYLQKVRLILATSASFPRVQTMTPDDVSLSGTANNFAFTITGVNLSCSSNPASCGTSVKFQQSGNTYTASCTGNTNPATQLSCTVNLASASAGIANLVISNSGGTLTLPGSPLIGGVNVTP